MELAKPSNDFEHKLIANIEQYGYQVNSVKADKESLEPQFSYTIGFWASYGHPEILICGLHFDVAREIFHSINTGLSSGGVHFKAGDKNIEFIENYECVFLSVLPENYKDYVLSAKWLYSGESFPVLQLVFQDENHDWPWQDGASFMIKRNQPVLGEYEKFFNSENKRGMIDHIVSIFKMKFLR